MAKHQIARPHQGTSTDELRIVLDSLITGKYTGSQALAEIAIKDIRKELKLREKDTAQTQAEQPKLVLPKITVLSIEQLAIEDISIKEPTKVTIDKPEFELSSLAIMEEKDQFIPKPYGKISPACPKQWFCIKNYQTPSPAGFNSCKIDINPTTAGTEQSYFVHLEDGKPTGLKIIPVPINGRVLTKDGYRSITAIEAEQETYKVETTKTSPEFIPTKPISKAEKDFWNTRLPLPKKLDSILKKAAKNGDVKTAVEVIKQWMSWKGNKCAEGKTNFRYIYNREIGKLMLEYPQYLPEFMSVLRVGNCQQMAWYASSMLRKYGFDAFVTSEVQTTPSGTRFDLSTAHARVMIVGQDKKATIFDPTEFIEKDRAYNENIFKGLIPGIKKRFDKGEVVSTLEEIAELIQARRRVCEKQDINSNFDLGLAKFTNWAHHKISAFINSGTSLFVDNEKITYRWAKNKGAIWKTRFVRDNLANFLKENPDHAVFIAQVLQRYAKEKIVPSDLNYISPMGTGSKRFYFLPESLTTRDFQIKGEDQNPCIWKYNRIKHSLPGIIFPSTIPIADQEKVTLPDQIVTNDDPFYQSLEFPLLSAQQELKRFYTFSLHELLNATLVDFREINQEISVDLNTSESIKLSADSYVGIISLIQRSCFVEEDREKLKKIFSLDDDEFKAEITSLYEQSQSNSTYAEKLFRRSFSAFNQLCLEITPEEKAKLMSKFQIAIKGSICTNPRPAIERGYDARRYIDGDDIRTVDWNATARRDHVMVRPQERSKENNEAIFVTIGELNSDTSQLKALVFIETLLRNKNLNIYIRLDSKEGNYCRVNNFRGTPAELMDALFTNPESFREQVRTIPDSKSPFTKNPKFISITNKFFDAASTHYLYKNSTVLFLASPELDVYPTMNLEKLLG